MTEEELMLYINTVDFGYSKELFIYINMYEYKDNYYMIFYSRRRYLNYDYLPIISKLYFFKDIYKNCCKIVNGFQVISSFADLNGESNILIEDSDEYHKVLAEGKLIYGIKNE